MGESLVAGPYDGQSRRERDLREPVFRTDCRRRRPGIVHGDRTGRQWSGSCPGRLIPRGLLERSNLRDPAGRTLTDQSGFGRRAAGSSPAERKEALRKPEEAATARAFDPRRSRDQGSHPGAPDQTGICLAQECTSPRTTAIVVGIGSQPQDGRQFVRFIQSTLHTWAGDGRSNRPEPCIHGNSRSVPGSVRPIHAKYRQIRASMRHGIIEPRTSIHRQPLMTRGLGTRGLPACRATRPRLPRSDVARFRRPQELPAVPRARQPSSLGDLELFPRPVNQHVRHRVRNLVHPELRQAAERLFLARVKPPGVPPRLRAACSFAALWPVTPSPLMNARYVAAAGRKRSCA